MTEFQARGFERTSPRTIELSSVHLNRVRNTLDIRAKDGAAIALPMAMTAGRPDLAELKSGTALDQSVWFRLQRDARIAQSLMSRDIAAQMSTARGASR